jgi:23S rRNA (cytosine1962-C5)-methyltransferase
MKRIILKKGEDDRIWRGHPWVYDNEVQSILEGNNSAQLVAGELADVETYNKKYLGRSFVNPASKIIARLYSKSKEGIDTGFFKKRIRESIERRKSLGFDILKESCRLIFAEADFLPGLIIDSFVGWNLSDIKTEQNELPSFDSICSVAGEPLSFLTVQALIYGIDERLESIFQALNELSDIIKPSCIIEKLAPAMRNKENLKERPAKIQGEVPLGGILIFENDMPFIVDIAEGQKTGSYLDQKDNHKIARKMAVGKKRVLDVFCYSGGFALNAAKGGAEEVIAVDSSRSALDLVMRNANINGLQDKIKTMHGDAFEILTSLERAKEKFDLIILDPPSFASSHTTIESAAKGYKEINLKALKMLNVKGVLITCSCSHAMDENRFKKLIQEAAEDSERRIVQNYFCYQSSDHPILLGYDESLYLKCGVYTVVR